MISPHYDAMLAKVIAHGRTRAEAARRLARALERAEIHGVTTNRDLLVAILREPEFLAGGTDTGYLTRHDPAALATAPAEATALHAAGGRPGPAGARTGRRRRSWARCRPAGATSIPPRSRSATTRPARGTPWPTTSPAVPSRRPSTANPWERRSTAHAATATHVDLEVDGTRRQYRVHRAGAETYVDASNGSSALAEVPRFGDPQRAAPAGSLLAPMPGLVLRVLADVGSAVTAGQPLLVLEAMKMEQTVTAPAGGVVAELRAKAGDQVSTGQILAVVEA